MCGLASAGLMHRCRCGAAGGEVSYDIRGASDVRRPVAVLVAMSARVAYRAGPSRDVPAG